MNRKEEIQKELEGISPYLAGLQLRPGFKVPKGYFDELPDTILESVSPLAALKKEQAFKVPANYFESLPDLVLDRVQPSRDTEEVATPAPAPQSSWLDDLINSVAVLFQPRYALRLATVAILLVGGVLFMQNLNETDSSLAGTDPVEAVDELTEDDLAVLFDDLEDVENEDLLDEMLEELDELSDEDLEGILTI